MTPLPTKTTFTGLLLVLELPLYLLAFLGCWLVAWLLAMVALVLALVTLGTLTIPPMSQGLADVLLAPKRWSLDPKK